MVALEGLLPEFVYANSFTGVKRMIKGNVLKVHNCRTNCRTSDLKEPIPMFNAPKKVRDKQTKTDVVFNISILYEVSRSNSAISVILQ